MSSVVISGDTSGSVSLTVPAVAGTNTATLPAATGTVMVSGNMPAFSAYLLAVQTVSAATITKVQINTKVFDTASAFDNTTNYRFTPQVAGYYQVNCQLTGTGSVSTNSIYAMLYKNGSIYQYGSISQNSAMIGGQASTLNTLIYLNGSTDYIEFYGLVGGAGTITFAATSGQQTYFSASLVRAA